MNHNYKPGEMVQVGGPTWAAEVKFIGFTSGGYLVAENKAGELSTWMNHRPLSTKRTRMMTAKELAGKWVSVDPKYFAALVVGFRCDQVRLSGEKLRQLVNKDWLFTTTPADDSSWRSVLITEGEE